jgi:Protein of unknown function (DUF1573)
MRIPAVILTLLAGGPACLASLQWETTDLQLKARPGQESMTVAFPYHNSGHRTVRILSVDPSCSCVSAGPEKAVCAPGESGAIRVELNLAGYIGRVRRSLAVTTDDPVGRFAELTLSVDIPEVVTIIPRFLFWRVGDPPDAKSAEIVVTEPATTTVGEIECDNPRFRAQLTPGPAGRYRLVVNPADTQQPSDATVRVAVSIEGRPQASVIYVAVK